MKPLNTCQYGSNTVYIYESAAALKSAATEYIAQHVIAESTKTPIFSIALSGGSTPVDVYKGLVSDKWIKAFPWQHCYFVFGDERYVSQDHEQSNYKMAMDAFLKKAPVDAKHIYPVPTQCEHPDDCADMYERQLIEALTNESNNEMPEIDLVLLGMGDDGHTASIFPGTDILNESESAFAAVYVDKLDSWRISMTLPCLNKAKQIMVLVSGETKATVLADVLLSDEKKYPIQLFNNPHGALWFIDQAAASQLE